MAFAFGQDTDWTSFFTEVVKTAGAVTTAAIGKNTTATTTLPPNYTGQGLTTTAPAPGMSTSTMLLLGLAAVLGVVLVMKISKRRSAGG